MSEFLKSLEETAKPFVVFRLPHSQKISCYYQTDLNVHYTTGFDESGFVFAPFESQKEFLFIPDTHRASIDHPQTISSSSFELTIDQNETRELSKKIDRAKANIAAKKFEKVVMSSAFDFPYTAPLVDVFFRLEKQHPNAFIYYWFHPETGYWLGATPERFIALKKGVLSTVALAGTLTEKAPAEAWTVKEFHEQQLVIESIAQGLTAAFPQGDVSIGTRETIHAGRLQHLRTPIDFVHPALDLNKVITVLHPTPAVGGWPKEVATAFINDHEDYDRAYYTGFLGPFHNTRQVDFFVNLRCANYQNGEIRLYAGAGITNASITSKECEEIYQKAANFLDAL